MDIKRIVPDGFYCCDIHHDKPLYLIISGNKAVFADLYSMPGDTILTSFDYEQRDENIIRLLNDEYFYINVSEVLSDQHCDSIEVFPTLENVTETKGWLSLTFCEVKGAEDSTYKIFYDPSDPKDNSFKIPMFSTDTQKVVMAKFTPSTFRTFAQNNEIYYGAINYFADPLWDLLDRSNPVFTPSDSLKELKISIKLNETDFFKPHFLGRLAIVEYDNIGIASIWIDDMQFKHVNLSPVEEKDLITIINRWEPNIINL